MKRLFQVAVFGASDAANKKAIASIARARGCDLAVIPKLDGGRALSCSYDRIEGTLHARFYVRAVAGYALSTQAFYTLLGIDTVVFVPSGDSDELARDEMKTIFKTYGEIRVVDVATFERAILDGFRARRIKGRSLTTPSPAYLARVRALVAAADIAIELGPRTMRRFHEETRGDALYPEPQFANVRSLAQTESDFFVYWNEAPARQVAKFWREVARRKLPFKRRDIVAEVLAKGRITNRQDYDTVTDLLGDEKLTAAQRARLDRMLGAYSGT